MSVKNHLSSNNTLASARQVTSNEINLILKYLNTKKASGTDKMPTKLVKLASNVLSTSLATAINNSPHDLLLAKLAPPGIKGLIAFLMTFFTLLKLLMPTILQTIIH